MGDVMLHPRDLNILILDADPNRIKPLRDFFIRSGVKLVSSDHDFYSAENYFTDQKYHIIVIGDECTDGNALEAIKILKKNDTTKSASLLVYTSDNEPGKIRSMIAEGACGIIHYPADSRQVSLLLRNYMRDENTAELKSLVKKSPFFEELSPAELQQLCQVAIVRHFPAGTTIVTKNDPSDRFFVLLKGKVEILISKKYHVPMRLIVEEGHSFGEMGILDNAPRSAFCIAAKDCWVLEVGAHIIHDTEYSLRLKILTKMAFVLAKRIRKMNALLSPNSTDAVPASETPEQKKNVASPPKGTSLPKEKNVAPATTEKLPPPEDNLPLENKSSSDENPFSEENLEEENPWTSPCANAEALDESTKSEEEYSVLTCKINLRTDFIFNKIPKALCDSIVNRMYAYWTGGKLAKINPHRLWNTKSFIEGTPRLKRALHLVVLCSHGEAAYQECYLNLPFSHRVVGLSHVGCTGTFLASDEAIHRYFSGKLRKKAIKMDLEMPIDRTWKGEESIEFLSHTNLDVRNETLFLVFDERDGKNTKLVRSCFPEHQIITVVLDVGFNPEDLSTVFTKPEQILSREQLINSKTEFAAHGFYHGETVFIPDFSYFYRDVPALKRWAHVFGTIGIFANVGPDYSGIIWGSKGGAEGAIKASRAMYGLKGAQSAQDLAAAINWADG